VRDRDSKLRSNLLIEGGLGITPPCGIQITLNCTDFTMTFRPARWPGWLPLASPFNSVNEEFHADVAGAVVAKNVSIEFFSGALEVPIWSILLWDLLGTMTTATCFRLLKALPLSPFFPFVMRRIPIFPRLGSRAFSTLILGTRACPKN